MPREPSSLWPPPIGPSDEELLQNWTWGPVFDRYFYTAWRFAAVGFPHGYRTPEEGEADMGARWCAVTAARLIETAAAMRIPDEPFRNALCEAINEWIDSIIPDLVKGLLTDDCRARAFLDDRLPRRSRRLLFLYRVDPDPDNGEFTYDELSVLFGLTRNALYQLRQNALRKLNDLIDEYQGEQESPCD